ncbi:MAG: AMP-binding protein [Chloroflexi bacterium]|nr:AMP-binding protein [Chloroflexota bacterium]
MSVDTVLHRLHENGRSRANAPAYYVRSKDHWVPTTWKEYLEEVRQAAKGLVALGFEAKQGVCILGFNRPEWVIFNLAGLLAGGHGTGIYTSNSPDEVQYIIDHSEAPFVLVEDEAQWQKNRPDSRATAESEACYPHERSHSRRSVGPGLGSVYGFGQ